MHDMYIDNTGPYDYDLTMEKDTVDVSSWHTGQPDPEWFHIDSHGHFHAFDLDGSNPLPTLTAEDVTVQYDLGDFEATFYANLCMLCKEPVTPNYLPGAVKEEFAEGTLRVGFTIPKYNRSISKNQRVSFYTTVMFGIARVVAFGVDENWDGKSVSATFEAEFAVKRNHGV